MKVLVVLVLASFTGCKANPLNADRPKPKLELVLDLLSNICETNFEAAGQIYRNLWRTEFGEAVIDPLKNRARATEEMVDQFMQSLPPTAKATIRTSVRTGIRLASNVGEYLVKNHLEPMAESEAPVMEKSVGELFLDSQVVQDLVSPYLTELMDRVDPIFKDIQARLHAFHQSVVKTE